MVQVTQHNGRRWSTADAYLRPAAQRANLEVVTGAQVAAASSSTAGGRPACATARPRGRDAAAAEREVILCAGAIGSPQLLMLSGIGPAEHLREVGVPVRHDLPGVGRNLQDHPYVTMRVGGRASSDSLYDAEKPRVLAEWLLRRSGPLTSTVAEAFAFVRSRPGLPAADLQFHFAPPTSSTTAWRSSTATRSRSRPVLVSPRSRGTVQLRSADPTAKPRILTNSLAEPEDVAALVAGMRLAREIAGQRRRWRPPSGAS